ncbi:MAG: DUF4132 domain-containing protein [Acidobacteriota bacterium]
METIQEAVTSLRQSREEFERQLEQNPGLVKARFATGPRSSSTLLIEAIKTGDMAKSKALLARGADVADQPQNLVVVATGHSSHDFDPALLKLVLDRGAPFPSDPRECQRYIYGGLAVIFRGAPKTLDLLLSKGFDPPAFEQKGRRSLVAQAIESEDHLSITACVKKLLACGCSLVSLEGDREPDRSVLFDACESGSVPVAKVLLKAGCDINQPDADGRTPLIFAIDWGHKALIEHFLGAGADVNLRNAKGQTALDVAQSKSGFKRVAAKLKKAGAKTQLELEAGGSAEKQRSADLLQHLQGGEPWADRLIREIESLDDKTAEAWRTLIAHCEGNSTAKPSSRWRKQAAEPLGIIGADDFYSNLLTSLVLAPEMRTRVLDPRELAERFDWIVADRIDPSWTLEEFEQNGHRGIDLGPFVGQRNTRVLKGLIWLASDYPQGETSSALRKIAAAMYKKVPGIGMRNAALGNAAVYSLSCMADDVGLKEIITLRAATKYNPALVNINRVFDRLAKERNVDPEELASIAVPDFGLTDVGIYRRALGDYEVSLTLEWTGKVAILWSRDGKSQKSVPAPLKAEFKDEIKAIRALAKELAVAVSAHSQRIEQLYLQDHRLDLPAWREQYADHRLLGFLARRLIWRFQTPCGPVNALYTPDGYVDSAGRPVTLDEAAEVSLWHPMSCEVQEVLAWRRLLLEQGRSQPFKQAHREIYILTDAERATGDHSLRFADQILKQHQFHALATQRKWQQRRGGAWDGGDGSAASKKVPGMGLIARLEATSARAYGLAPSGVFACVATSEVTFDSDKGRMRLEDVPEVAFSELMRDVDLFVGVSAIGNDPDWRDREDENWLWGSFGDLTAAGETRKEVLEALLPKLKISKQVTIDGNFLIVEGALKSYRIHLGSSNIQILPNKSYLCIVDTRPDEKILLPFTGDRTLSLILSKAFLLAKDDKIKDKTILSQIHSAS